MDEPNTGERDPDFVRFVGIRMPEDQIDLHYTPNELPTFSGLYEITSHPLKDAPIIK